VTTFGDETLLRFIYPGDTMGCVAIAEMDYQVASAQALRPCRTWIWSREAALKLLREVPIAAVNLISAMVRDYYHYYQQVRRLRTDPLDRRIEWSLLELSRALGESTSEGTIIEVSGYRQLAELAGTNIYSVSRELSKLERRGILRKYRGRIVLIAPERLLLQERVA
jgi:CRP/FNR family transcriptional regulator, nitrogen oxide reductase regulator